MEGYSSEVFKKGATYHSTFGKYVTETNVALVAVKNNEAYTALIHLGDVNLVIPPAKCVTASAAQMARTQDGAGFAAVVLLEEDNASR